MGTTYRGRGIMWKAIVNKDQLKELVVGDKVNVNGVKTVVLSQQEHGGFHTSRPFIDCLSATSNYFSDYEGLGEISLAVWVEDNKPSTEVNSKDFYKERCINSIMDNICVTLECSSIKDILDKSIREALYSDDELLQRLLTLEED